MVFSKVLASGTQATTDLRLPLMWFTAIAACGGVAGALLALARLIEDVRGVRKETAGGA
jgi:TRAP-type C4-dicarboxylate transport system permease small subunit